MKNYILLITFSILLIGCNDNEKQQEDLLYKEVMTIHDEVMPEMPEMKKLAKTLDEKIGILMADSLNLDSAHVGMLKQTSKNVKKANESMMDWMHNFKQTEEGTPHGEVMRYLTKQKESISKVRDDMMTVKKEAEKYIIVEQ